VALLQIIRWILAYIDRRMQLVSASTGNRLALSVVACVNYLVACFNVALKFATRAAYVVIAIRGEPFCLATKNGFVLISSLAVDAVVTASLAWLVLFFGRLVVIGVGAYVTYLLVDQSLTSPILPVTVSAILAWFVGGAFLDLYSDAIDTMLIVRSEEKLRGELLERERDSDMGAENEKSAMVLV